MLAPQPSAAVVRLAAAALLGLGAARGVPAAPEAASEAFFESHVRPLLLEKCVGCHGDKKSESGLRLDSLAAMLRGGDSGPAIVPGKAGESLLVSVLKHGGDIQMPPETYLPEDKVGLLERWIEAGAHWPGVDGGAVAISTGPTDAQKNHWAFQPIADPPVPRVAVAPGEPQPANPIDAFLMAKLAERGLDPVGPADRRTLIRRASFDLTGLPPEPAEVEAFERDQSPDAFARLVDRLLASPAYGERWGRHWLDVARYADTAGETGDYPVPDAWRYRNYVIDAFNADKPFDRFIREQVAGDILAAEADPAAFAELVSATGFIAVSRRFGFDSASYMHLTYQDTIDTVGQAVLGLTVGCARCHDHKYDPISAADYYAFYGIFQSTRYAFPGDEQTKRPKDMVPLLPPEQLSAAQNSPPFPTAYAVAEGTPSDAPIQKRGEPARPGEIVPRRFLTILGGDPVPPGGGSGRRELALWLTRPENPLTARVIVNRVWQQHFGRGLVATPNDFGLRSQPPSHPELLDWLATRFREQGWSLKWLHRQILSSQAYGRSSRTAAAAAADPANEWLWRFTRRRLSAEEIRDSLLLFGGGLDTSPGQGHPFPPVDTWGFTQHAPFAAVYDSPKRSVYLMTPRLARHPLLALFDGPDANASTASRSATTVPSQALFWMNSPLVHEQAAGFARRLLETPDPADRVRLAIETVFGRPADPAEVDDWLAFVERYAAELAAAGGPAADRAQAAWAACARTLFAANEFVHVD
jgi:hypothetical protein